MLNRLNKNKNRYCGEKIDIELILSKCRKEAKKNNLEVLDLPVLDNISLLALKLTVPDAKKNIYIGAGIHGDEPAGPVAVERLLHENDWPQNVNIWICPCLNPTGFLLNTRDNDRNIDQNRDYKCLRAAETRTHVKWLESLPTLDIALMLHEDWEAEGFYLYEKMRDPTTPLAKEMLEEVNKIFPIDHSSNIDGFNASGGVILSGTDFENSSDETDRDYPEAFYLFMNKTNLAYTLETSSDFHLEQRVNALVTAVKKACKEIAKI